eukprot:GGOE01041375.1.p1 GENE.GGOE01041375.1~~GGOE01041375.1.p1  ORF type:complete len:349 (-),score=81.40 GGOE01041375.1:355-1260(-)
MAEKSVADARTLMQQLKVDSCEQRTMSECFKLFDVIHHLTDTLDIIQRATQEVLRAYGAENTVYLELRSSPRRLEGRGFEDYIEAVLAGVAAATNAGNAPATQLLLSINRAKAVQDAHETIEVARRYRDRGIVGVELSGNPYVGSFDAFRPALQLAKRDGLCISLHFAEATTKPEEVDQMLDFRPNRVGHACFMTEAQEARLLRSGIPVEVCLTSNILTKSVPHAAAHHFRRLWASSHPTALCCDDRGVFATSLTEEYLLAERAFGLTPTDLQGLAAQSIAHAFLSADAKRDLSFTLTKNY